jgi:hypothetical protein
MHVQQSRALYRTSIAKVKRLRGFLGFVAQKSEGCTSGQAPELGRAETNGTD